MDLEFTTEWKNRNKGESEKTKLTYLPPIDASITNLSTICRLFQTLDAGAYVNAYRVLINYPDIFSKIYLHLRDFYFMQKAFTILGALVKRSGFEDVIFHAGVCSKSSS